jgi:acetyl-CoA carboxylase biotin carboxyl carrier protein
LPDLNDADVLRILELVDKSSFDYFQLTLGDLRITVSKEGLPGDLADASASPPTAGATAPPSATAGAPAAPPPAPAAPLAAAGAAAAPAPDRSGLATVPAPMVGTFYRAPEPGAPPFTDVGAMVDADATLGLVEAMKVFTSILAGVRGEVVEILAENAQFVEYGQPLFLIRPETAGEARPA